MSRTTYVIKRTSVDENLTTHSLHGITDVSTIKKRVHLLKYFYFRVNAYALLETRENESWVTSLGLAGTYVRIVLHPVRSSGHYRCEKRREKSEAQTGDKTGSCGICTMRPLSRVVCIFSLAGETSPPEVARCVNTVCVCVCVCVCVLGQAK